MGDNDIEMAAAAAVVNNSLTEPNHHAETGSSTQLDEEVSPEFIDGAIATTYIGGQSTAWALRRELNSWHIFMISVSTCIGMGFYIRTGNIQSLGGQGAAIYSYALLGVISYMVMHNLANMLRIWPVAGALFLYVKHFLDEEVGIAIAIVYWLTYCLSFSALAATVADLLAYFNLSSRAEAGIMVLCLVIPVALNMIDIRIFRKIQIVMGCYKLIVALVVILAMNIVNADYVQPQKRDDLFIGGEETKAGWFGGFMASIFLSSFSFVGIEVVAATAQEAEVYERQAGQPSPTHRNVIDQFSWPAKWVPNFVTLIYVWGAWAATANVPADQAAYFHFNSNLPDIPGPAGPTMTSIFVYAAHQYSPKLASALTILLITSLLTTATSANFVASRSLYGFASDMQRRQGFWKPVFDFCGRKNKFDAPVGAVLTSAWLFWVPFLIFSNSSTFGQVVNLVTDMGSVCCVLVWTCESLAAMRLYYCYKCHKVSVDRESPRASEPMQTNLLVENKHWYLGNMAISGIAAGSSLLIIVLGGAMAFVENEVATQGVASFGVLSFFILLVALLKVFRVSNYGFRLQRPWNPLDTPAEAQFRFDKLNVAREKAGAYIKRRDGESFKLSDLW